MKVDSIVGSLLIAVALILLTVLVFTARKRIDRIARRGYRSARHIVKELEGDE
jgi:hypothetical protein